MKSLILKDLYNIGHNIKSMLFMLVVFAFCLIPGSGVEGYIVACALLCGMMVVTTFSFDDSANWTRYAMVMPIERKDLIMGKFVVLAIFGAAGSLFGLLAGSVGGAIAKKVSFDSLQISQLLLLTLLAWIISFVFGSMSIPLAIKFGAEKGRMLLLVSLLVPGAVCVGIYQLLKLLKVEVTDRSLPVLICAALIAAIVWCYGMYRVSCRVFSKREL